MKRTKTKTAKAQADIRWMRKQGIRTGEIAATFGVDIATPSKWGRGIGPNLKNSKKISKHVAGLKLNKKKDDLLKEGETFERVIAEFTQVGKTDLYGNRVDTHPEVIAFEEKYSAERIKLRSKIARQLCDEWIQKQTKATQ